MMHVWCYVPKDHLEVVKKAMFEAGAGRLGNYQACAWQTLGQGQFIPLEGSDPYEGAIEECTYVEEYKLEIMVALAQWPMVEIAMIQTHPYEVPAYGAVPVSNREQR